MGSRFVTFLHQLQVKRSKKDIIVIYTSLDKSKDEIQYDLSAFDWNIDNLTWDFIDISPTSKKKLSNTLK